MISLEKLNLTNEEMQAVVEILKNAKIVLPIYRRLANYALDIVESKIEDQFDEAEKEMRKFMIDNES